MGGTPGATVGRGIDPVAAALGPGLPAATGVKQAVPGGQRPGDTGTEGTGSGPEVVAGPTGGAVVSEVPPHAASRASKQTTSQCPIVTSDARSICPVPERVKRTSTRLLAKMSLRRYENCHPPLARLKVPVVPVDDRRETTVPEMLTMVGRCLSADRE
jgi:hypothetical protein